MSLNYLKNKNLNGLLGFFDSLSVLVLWMRSADYKKQLHLSSGYKKIWRRDPELLFKRPQSWADSLVSDKDLVNFNQRCRNDYTGTIYYSIRCPNGCVQYIKDQSCRVINSDGQCVAVVGIAELIPHNYLKIFMLEQERYPALNPALTDCLKILSKEYLLTPDKNNKYNATENKIFGTLLTKREIQITDLLKKGYTAKKTALVLGISSRTVETHLENIRKKIGSNSKMELLSQIIR